MKKTPASFNPASFNPASFNPASFTVPLLLALLAGCVPAASESPERADTNGINQPPASEVPASVLPKRPLQCDLEAKPTYRRGEPVEVIFRLKNLGDKPLWVLRWNTPFEGLVGDCFEIFHGKEVVYFQGRMVKRASPEASEYVMIPAGKSQEARVDLRGAYTVEAPGQYSLSFDTALFDVTDDEGLVPRPLEDHQSFDPHCPEVVFEVR